MHGGPANLGCSRPGSANFARTASASPAQNFRPYGLERPSGKPAEALGQRA